MRLCLFRTRRTLRSLHWWSAWRTCATGTTACAAASGGRLKLAAMPGRGALVQILVAHECMCAARVHPRAGTHRAGWGQTLLPWTGVSRSKACTYGA